MAQRFNPPFGTAGKMAKPVTQGKPIENEAPRGDLEAAEEQDGAAIAHEHGPTSEIHMTHDDEMGVHHVQSTHPDGHAHESDHGSREEAHEHAKKLSGIGAEESGGEEEAEPWGKE